MSASIEVNADEFYISLTAALAQMDDKMFAVTEQTGAEVAHGVAALAPWRHIKRSVRHTVRRSGTLQTATVRAGGLSQWAEFGTAAHIIRARTRRYLSWVGGDGVRRFAKVVHHPGTRPIPFFRTATQPTRVAAALRKAVRTVFG